MECMTRAMLIVITPCIRVVKRLIRLQQYAHTLMCVLTFVDIGMILQSEPFEGGLDITGWCINRNAEQCVIISNSVQVCVVQNS